MYEITCWQCKQLYPRIMFRKKAGGVHALCAKCRKKIYNDTARLKKKLRVVHQQYAEETKTTFIMERTAMLMHEYNRATGANRAKIKLLESKPRVTKATIKSLERRKEEQALWDTTLASLLVKINAGLEAPSLRHAVALARKSDV